MTGGDRVTIPATQRRVWPGSRMVGPLAADSDALLTAWLRPKRGGELDRELAGALGAAPPARGGYADRKALAERTGADPADVDALRTYCHARGIRVVDSHWRSVTVGGTLEQLIGAFGATVASYETGGGQRFRHRSGALYASAEIASIVRGVFGLHQWPRSRKLGSLQRHATPLRAHEVAARYRFPGGDGTGETIGILQLRGIFKPEDFQKCMRAQGLAPPLPVVKRVDDAIVAHEVATTQDLEAALDVQIVAALVPGARIVVYEAPDDERGFLDAVRDAIFDQELAPTVLSISYGWPEQLWTPAALDLLDDLFAAAALTGISVFCASGDNGAELDEQGRPHVLAPASSPFAIACGATVVAGAHERAWEKSGGGFSERFGVPQWQDVARHSASRYGRRAGRGVPDVAAQQVPGYYVVMDGQELAMGGTSAVAPVWAALAARINQRLGARAGFFAPRLYGQPGQGLFTDVTTGSNGTFEAGAGWNPCAGLGVPIGTALAQALGAASHAP